MKKIISLLLTLVLSVTLVACNSKTLTKTDDASGKGKKPLKVTLVVNGNLGDLGFFDSANAGMERLKKDFGIIGKVIETGSDQSKWEPALSDAAEEDVDIIIAVSPSMVEAIQKVAPLYPNKKFILIDNSVDFKKGDFKNVYCATFKQNEGSFLAGALAAYVTTAKLPNANANKKIGFVGGMDIPPINDFLVGYIEGALYVDKEIKVVATYPGDYYDPAKGKEHGIVQINNGVDVIFPAAGPTGLGTIEAAKEKGIYIIGVDSDQSAGYKANGDTKTAEIIVSSMIKNVGNTIYRAIDLYSKDQLPLGKSESLGIKEGGVGLAKNDIYKSTLSKEIIDNIEKIQEKVIKGEIKVDTAVGMSAADLTGLKTKVAP